MQKIPEAKIYENIFSDGCMRRYANILAKKYLRWKCSTIGCTNMKKLEAHHKNGNPWDNRLENLMPLCCSCHHKIDGRIKNIPRERMGLNPSYLRIKKYKLYRNKKTGRFMKWGTSKNKLHKHDGIRHWHLGVSTSEVTRQKLILRWKIKRGEVENYEKPITS